MDINLNQTKLKILSSKYHVYARCLTALDSSDYSVQFLCIFSMFYVDFLQVLRFLPKNEMVWLPLFAPSCEM